MTDVRRTGYLLLTLAILAVCVSTVDAGILKGYVYDVNGQLIKTGTVSITVKDTASESIGFGSSKTDGSFSVTFDSTKIESNLLIIAEFKLSGNTTTIGTAGSATVGGLIGTGITHNLHVLVK